MLYLLFFLIGQYDIIDVRKIDLFDYDSIYNEYLSENIRSPALCLRNFREMWRNIILLNKIDARWTIDRSKR